MKMKQALLGLAAMLVVFAANANAQVPALTVAMSGSSAIYQELGQAAYSKYGCIWVSPGKDFKLTDSRGNTKYGSSAPVATDSGAAWVAWNANGGTCAAPVAGETVVMDVSVDSTVGNRCFFATPQCALTTADTTSTASGSALPGTTNTSTLPAGVLAAIGGPGATGTVSMNAAATDIRPEDAKFATLRALTPCGNAVVAGSQYLGEGYNTSNAGVGTGIHEYNTATIFNVQDFNLSGSDPISGSAVTNSAFTVTTVGAVPVVVVVNPANENGLGSLQLSNINRATLSGYLDGTFGAITDGFLQGFSTAPTAGVIVAIREPVSGTYNTMEYAIANNVENQSSQDVGLAAYNTNLAGNSFPPYNCTATGGTVSENPLAETDLHNAATSYRVREIGTGDEVAAVLGGLTPPGGSSVVKQDLLGYSFWSAANFKNATAQNAKYLTVDGIDPIQETWVDGLVPTAGNELLGNVTMAHVKDGSYPIWSFVRVVSNATTNTAVTALATTAANFLSPSYPDFVAPGQMAIVRSHFVPPGTTLHCNAGVPSNGDAGNAECGGAVGGLSISQQADKDYDLDNGGLGNGDTAHRQ